MNVEYPKRGTISADGKFYTNKNGQVFGKDNELSVCKKGHCKVCVNLEEFCSHWSKIESISVPSEEVAEAIIAMRIMIEQCDGVPGRCRRCSLRLMGKVCAAREYLEKHGIKNAWEAI